MRIVRREPEDSAKSGVYGSELCFAILAASTLKIPQGKWTQLENEAQCLDKGLIFGMKKSYTSWDRKSSFLEVDATFPNLAPNLNSLDTRSGNLVHKEDAEGLAKFANKSRRDPNLRVVFAAPNAYAANTIQYSDDCWHQYGTDMQMPDKYVRDIYKRRECSSLGEALKNAYIGDAEFDTTEHCKKRRTDRLNELTNRCKSTEAMNIVRIGLLMNKRGMGIELGPSTPTSGEVLYPDLSDSARLVPLLLAKTKEWIKYELSQYLLNNFLNKENFHTDCEGNGIQGRPLGPCTRVSGEEVLNQMRKKVADDEKNQSPLKQEILKIVNSSTCDREMVTKLGPSLFNREKIRDIMTKFRVPRDVETCRAFVAMYLDKQLDIIAEVVHAHRAASVVNVFSQPCSSLAQLEATISGLARMPFVSALHLALNIFASFTKCAIILDAPEYLRPRQGRALFQVAPAELVSDSKLSGPVKETRVPCILLGKSATGNFVPYLLGPTLKKSVCRENKLVKPADHFSTDQLEKGSIKYNCEGILLPKDITPVIHPSPTIFWSLCVKDRSKRPALHNDFLLSLHANPPSL